MLNHMGFSCWISSKNTPMQTYNEEALGDMRSAWIASEPGKSFSVHWQDKSGKRIATSGHVFVDGKDVASAIIRPGRVEPVKRSGVKVGRSAIKSFVFSELELTDDDTLANRYDTSLRNVGTIRVEIKRVRLGAEVPFTAYEAENLDLVHERAKKAGAHCTKFTDAKRIENGRTVSISTAPYDPNELGPYVTFEFRYRSLAMLKATGIISNERKRPNENADEDVIEISSSDEEDSSVQSPSTSPHLSTPETAPNKRVKREPQPGESPRPWRSPSPAVADVEIGETSDTNTPSVPDNETLTQPEVTQDSEAAVILQEDSQTEQVMKEEREEEDEELDMLAGDDEGTASNDPSQDAETLEDDLLPPPSSSPGPEALTKEGDEDDS